MIPDWDNLEALEATERLLGAALEEGATEIHVSSDEEGAAVFMASNSNVEFHARLPTGCRDRVLSYLRGLGGIEPWIPAPARGLAGLALRGSECQLEIVLLKSESGEDAVIRISSTNAERGE